jgi:hypothetical protein
MKKDLLTRPFRPDQLKQRKGQHGKILTYVDVAAVIERLNEACDVWSFEIEKYEVQDGEAIVLGKLTADGVVKTAFGGSVVTVDREGTVVSIADDLKSAASDALKKAASMLGVGLELYGGVRREEPESEQPSASNRGPREHAPSAPTERVTTRQLAALAAACRRHGINRGELMDLVGRRTGKGELAHLSRNEASSLITEVSANGNGAGH